MTVLVTGGTGDVGSNVVSRLVGRGEDVVFGYCSASDRASEISRSTGALAVQCDLSVSSAPLLPHAREAALIIHCAGINVTSARTHDVPLDAWRKTLAVNVGALFEIARAALPGMVARRAGRVIAVGSIYSIRGSKFNTPYNASKHALAGLIKSVAADYGSSGVQANCVCPGAILSRMMAVVAARKAFEAGTSEDAFYATVASVIPDQRLATVSEVGAVVEYLALDAPDHINGEMFVVDGGQTS